MMLAEMPGMQDKVASVITMGPPHFMEFMRAPFLKSWANVRNDKVRVHCAALCCAVDTTPVQVVGWPLMRQQVPISGVCTPCRDAGCQAPADLVYIWVPHEPRCPYGVFRCIKTL